MDRLKVKITAITATALALVSCGGGGGSSSDTVSTATNDGKSNYSTYDSAEAQNSKKVLVNTPTEYIVEGLTNGDLFRTEERNPDEFGIMQDRDFYVNGKAITPAAYDRGEFMRGSFDTPHISGDYFAYNGKHGPSAVYGADTYKNVNSNFGTVAVVSNSDRVTGYNDVFYNYVVSNGDGTWSRYKGADGKITFDPATAKWGASFGGDKVILDGQLNGNAVSGTARYENLNGAFEGNDLYVKDRDTGKLEHNSAGAYAGSDGSKTFAGAWGQSDDQQTKTDHAEFH